ncbi:MAG: hypothetical protein H0U96_08680 [Acidobacteria bacterium]|nr:hypothetical protein [Acidobacteriota bacterium]
MDKFFKTHSKATSVDSTTRQPTVEMTWGETADTQRQGNGQANKQSRCFALTSFHGTVSTQSRRTIELTWGETATTQAKV